MTSLSHARGTLGVADVDDLTVAGMVADLLGHPRDRVRLLDSRAERVDYDVPSITTVGRHWVTGSVSTPDGPRAFRLFVKHVQAWRHSPYFASVPAELRDLAAASVPWRVEAAVYASDLATRLPEGLGMPRLLGVVDLEPETVVLWLEACEFDPGLWGVPCYERAARLLGRLSGSTQVAPVADVGAFPWVVEHYVHGRLAQEVLPRLVDDPVWGDPAVERAFGPLRPRLLAAAERIGELAAELATLPRAASHGDASPNNLLRGAERSDFILIDFGFWMSKSIGFDLGQLLAGETQLGRPLPAALPDLDERCLTAYLAGLRDEGALMDPEVVRRAHALQLLIYGGISALPDAGMGADQVVARAALARHSLDLVDRTRS